MQQASMHYTVLVYIQSKFHKFYDMAALLQTIEASQIINGNADSKEFIKSTWELHLN